ncbi:spore cortex biosynthesis protein YabQ [Paenibacillus montanisoli]|uniref:Spore cortex biosynthesis protein YabQ n=2 Tax=Paenibacillus montanisoli TaxID=2081970 RepID=A0A328TRV5_9BACL|nr:spore cortex biosynthesis protein YabQ [Paenibacillus montanisoli]
MLSMLVSGIGMGIVFDGYRVISDELRISRLWIPIFDLLYWIAATLVVFQVLSSSNEGEVRAYVFIGLLLGIGCYYWLFSRITMKLVQVLIRTTKAIIRFMIRAFDMLIIRPLVLLYRIGKLFLAFLRAFAIFLFKIVVQLVRPFWLLTAWMTRPIWKPLLRYWKRWVNPIIAKWRVPERIASLRAGASKLWQRWKNRKEEKKDD